MQACWMTFLRARSRKASSVYPFLWQENQKFPTSFKEGQTGMVLVTNNYSNNNHSNKQTTENATNDDIHVTCPCDFAFCPALLIFLVFFFRNLWVTSWCSHVGQESCCTIVWPSRYNNDTNSSLLFVRIALYYCLIHFLPTHVLLFYLRYGKLRVGPLCQTLQQPVHFRFP